MGMTKKARENQEKMGTDMLSALLETDPEFAERFADFAYDEVVNQDDLDDGTRMMAVLAALLGCQGAEAFREMVPAALNMGVTPVQLKEIVYQAVAYLDDGTMIVVENGRRKIGQTVEILVTSVLQTAAGRMIFGKVPN